MSNSETLIKSPHRGTEIEKTKCFLDEDDKDEQEQSKPMTQSEHFAMFASMF